MYIHINKFNSIFLTKDAMQIKVTVYVKKKGEKGERKECIYVCVCVISLSERIYKQKAQTKKQKRKERGIHYVYVYSDIIQRGCYYVLLSSSFFSSVVAALLFAVEIDAATAAA